LFKKNEFYAMLARREMTVKRLAASMNLNKATLYRKINGMADFTRAEIATIANVLSLDKEDIFNVFFNQNY